MVAHAHYPSTGDAEGGESQFQSTHGLRIRISQKKTKQKQQRFVCLYYNFSQTLPKGKGYDVD